MRMEKYLCPPSTTEINTDEDNRVHLLLTKLNILHFRSIVQNADRLEKGQRLGIYLKVIVLGDGYVGKSCLVNSYIDGRYAYNPFCARSRPDFVSHSASNSFK